MHVEQADAPVLQQPDPAREVAPPKVAQQQPNVSKLDSSP